MVLRNRGVRWRCKRGGRRWRRRGRERGRKRLRCVILPILLCACYAICGTAIGYAAMRPLCDVRRGAARLWKKPIPSGTAIAYAATCYPI
eukprot:730201-Rhodomonas_salina.1